MSKRKSITSGVPAAASAASSQLFPEGDLVVPKTFQVGEYTVKVTQDDRERYAGIIRKLIAGELHIETTADIMPLLGHEQTQAFEPAVEQFLAGLIELYNSYNMNRPQEASSRALSATSGASGASVTLDQDVVVAALKMADVLSVPIEYQPSVSAEDVDLSAAYLAPVRSEHSPYDLARFSTSSLAATSLESSKYSDSAEPPRIKDLKHAYQDYSNPLNMLKLFVREQYIYDSAKRVQFFSKYKNFALLEEALKKLKVSSMSIKERNLAFEAMVDYFVQVSLYAPQKLREGAHKTFVNDITSIGRAASKGDDFPLRPIRSLIENEKAQEFALAVLYGLDSDVFETPDFYEVRNYVITEIINAFATFPELSHNVVMQNAFKQALLMGVKGVLEGQDLSDLPALEVAHVLIGSDYMRAYERLAENPDSYLAQEAYKYAWTKALDQVASADISGKIETQHQRQMVKIQEMLIYELLSQYRHFESIGRKVEAFREIFALRDRDFILHAHSQATDFDLEELADIQRKPQAIDSKTNLTASEKKALEYLADAHKGLILNDVQRRHLDIFINNICFDPNTDFLERMNINLTGTGLSKKDFDEFKQFAARIRDAHKKGIPASADRLSSLLNAWTTSETEIDQARALQHSDQLRLSQEELDNLATANKDFESLRAYRAKLSSFGVMDDGSADHVFVKIAQSGQTAETLVERIAEAKTKSPEPLFPIINEKGEETLEKATPTIAAFFIKEEAANLWRHVENNINSHKSPLGDSHESHKHKFSQKAAELYSFEEQAINSLDAALQGGMESLSLPERIYVQRFLEYAMGGFNHRRKVNMSESFHNRLEKIEDFSDIEIEDSEALVDGLRALSLIQDPKMMASLGGKLMAFMVNKRNMLDALKHSNFTQEEMRFIESADIALDFFKKLDAAGIIKGSPLLAQTYEMCKAAVNVRRALPFYTSQLAKERYGRSYELIDGQTSKIVEPDEGRLRNIVYLADYMMAQLPADAFILLDMAESSEKKSARIYERLFEIIEAAGIDENTDFEDLRKMKDDLANRFKIEVRAMNKGLVSVSDKIAASKATYLKDFSKKASSYNIMFTHKMTDLLLKSSVYKTDHRALENGSKNAFDVLLNNQKRADILKAEMQSVFFDFNKEALSQMSQVEIDHFISDLTKLYYDYFKVRNNASQLDEPQNSKTKENLGLIRKQATELFKDAINKSRKAYVSNVQKNIATSTAYANATAATKDVKSIREFNEAWGRALNGIIEQGRLASKIKPEEVSLEQKTTYLRYLALADELVQQERELRKLCKDESELKAEFDKGVKARTQLVSGVVKMSKVFEEALNKWKDKGLRAQEVASRYDVNTIAVGRDFASHDRAKIIALAQKLVDSLDHKSFVPSRDRIRAGETVKDREDRIFAYAYDVIAEAYAQVPERFDPKSLSRMDQNFVNGLVNDFKMGVGQIATDGMKPPVVARFTQSESKILSKLDNRVRELIGPDMPGLDPARNSFGFRVFGGYSTSKYYFGRENTQFMIEMIRDTLAELKLTKPGMTLEDIVRVEDHVIASVVYNFAQVKENRQIPGDADYHFGSKLRAISEDLSEDRFDDKAYKKAFIQQCQLDAARVMSRTNTLFDLKSQFTSATLNPTEFYLTAPTDLYHKGLREYYRKLFNDHSNELSLLDLEEKPTSQKDLAMIHKFLNDYDNLLDLEMRLEEKAKTDPRYKKFLDKDMKDIKKIAAEIDIKGLREVYVNLDNAVADLRHVLESPTEAVQSKKEAISLYLDRAQMVFKPLHEEVAAMKAPLSPEEKDKLRNYLAMCKKFHVENSKACNFLPNVASPSGEEYALNHYFTHLALSGQMATLAPYEKPGKLSEFLRERRNMLLTQEDLERYMGQGFDKDFDDLQILHIEGLKVASAVLTQPDYITTPEEIEFAKETLADLTKNYIIQSGNIVAISEKYDSISKDLLAHISAMSRLYSAFKNAETHTIDKADAQNYIKYISKLSNLGLVVRPLVDLSNELDKHLEALGLSKAKTPDSPEGGATPAAEVREEATSGPEEEADLGLDSLFENGQKSVSSAVTQLPPEVHYQDFSDLPELESIPGTDTQAATAQTVTGTPVTTPVVGGPDKTEMKGLTSDEKAAIQVMSKAYVGKTVHKLEASDVKNFSEGIRALTQMKSEDAMTEIKVIEFAPGDKDKFGTVSTMKTPLCNLVTVCTTTPPYEEGVLDSANKFVTDLNKQNKIDKTLADELLAEIENQRFALSPDHIQAFARMFELVEKKSNGMTVEVEPKDIGDVSKALAAQVGDKPIKENSKQLEDLKKRTIPSAGSTLNEGQKEMLRKAVIMLNAVVYPENRKGFQSAERLKDLASNVRQPKARAIAAVRDFLVNVMELGLLDDAPDLKAAVEKIVPEKKVPTDLRDPNADPVHKERGSDLGK